MHMVDSSNIESIGYDADARELHVRFLQSGEIYVYYNVDEWIFTEFMAADSKGRYLNENIKSVYDCGKL